MTVESIAGAMPEMSEDQAKELARSLYFRIEPKTAEAQAWALRSLADKYQAHRIIAWYLNHPMLSPEGVAAYIKQELGLEDK
jgi:hypothetical protein